MDYGQTPKSLESAPSGADFDSLTPTGWEEVAATPNPLEKVADTTELGKIVPREMLQGQPAENQPAPETLADPVQAPNRTPEPALEKVAADSRHDRIGPGALNAIRASEEKLSQTGDLSSFYKEIRDLNVGKNGYLNNTHGANSAARKLSGDAPEDSKIVQFPTPPANLGKAA